MEDLESIVRAHEAIRRKYRAYQRGEVETSIKLEKHFKPVAEPLKAFLLGNKGRLKKEVKEEPPVKDEPKDEEPAPPSPFHYREEDEENMETYVQKFGALTQPYIRMILTNADQMDHIHGVRAGGSREAEWMLGNTPVEFRADDTLDVNGQPFCKLTRGLLELLFMRSPQEFSGVDKETYISLLELTNAHRRQYAAGKSLRPTTSLKYLNVIRPVFAKEPQWQGGRLRPRRRFVPLESKRTYIYWDNVNELVQRLNLLRASRDAGHTGLDREILSIEEELREAR